MEVVDEIEIATVKWFNSNDNKRFGFLTDKTGQDIFFHLNDGARTERYDASSGLVWFEQSNFKYMPKIGDKIAFVRVPNPKGPKALPWTPSEEYERVAGPAQYERTVEPIHAPKSPPKDRQPARVTPKLKVTPVEVMSDAYMRAVLTVTQPGDQLKLVFKNEDFNGSLKTRLYKVLALREGFGQQMAELKRIADQNSWLDAATLEFTFTVPEKWNAERFAQATIGEGLLQSLTNPSRLVVAPESPAHPNKVAERMRSVIESAKPGQRLKLRFRPDAFAEVQYLLLHATSNDFVQIDNTTKIGLLAVAESRRWEGVDRTVSIKVGNNFDPAAFHGRFNERALESIQPV